MSSGINTRVSLDQLVIKDLYYKYKQFLTPLTTIIICLLLFYFVVIPQIQNWINMRDALTVDTQNVAILHQNLALITQLDDAKLSAYLATATTALPADKDFAGIITSLRTASAVAGAGLGDYSFQLGNLSGLDQSGKASQLPVQLNIVLKADIPATQRFVAQLRKLLPLSDTIAIAANANASTTVTVLFYYAQLPHIVFHDTTPLPILGSSDKNLLDTLAANNNIGTVTLSSPSAQTVAPTPTITLAPTTIPTQAATGSAH